MSETHARGRLEQATAGGFLIAAASVLAAVLVIAGLAYAAGMSARHKAGLALNECEPSLSPSGLPCNTQQMTIGRYEAIVTPAAKQLNADMTAYRANERHRLAAAEAALTSEVATEQGLDNSLAAAEYTAQNYASAIGLITTAADAGKPTPSAAILLTPQATVIADALVRDNRALATLTADQAKSTSLTQLQSFDSRVEAASAAVLNEVAAVRRALNSRPTASQEP
jgi:hypothetical protein